MATFVLIPGAGSTSWYWHIVGPMLRARGHDTIAVTLPVDDDRAGFAEYAEATMQAIGDHAGRDDLVLVAQSLGGFTAPLVADRLPVRMIVLVAAMVPSAGESAGEWWTTTGAEQARIDLALADGRDPDDMEAMFVHDVDDAVAEAAQTWMLPQSGTPFAAPFPLAEWPDVPTRFLLCRDDRFFPADFQRRVVGERLGIVPDEMIGGHLPALAHPADLAARLDEYATAIAPRADPAAPATAAHEWFGEQGYDVRLRDRTDDELDSRGRYAVERGFVWWCDLVSIDHPEVVLDGYAIATDPDGAIVVARHRWEHEDPDPNDFIISAATETFWSEVCRPVGGDDPLGNDAWEVLCAADLRDLAAGSWFTPPSVEQRDRLVAASRAWLENNDVTAEHIDAWVAATRWRWPTVMTLV